MQTSHLKTFFLLLFSFASVHFVSAQKETKSRPVYKGLPVLQSNRDTIAIAVGDYRSSGWIISPQVASDTLRFGSLLPLQASFASDVDSIRYNVGPGESKHFYVKRNNNYAHTVIHNTASRSTLRYNRQCLPDSLQFFFNKDVASVAYYEKVRQQYPIDSCIATAKDDATRVLNLMHWTHLQWKHNGGQAPQKNDALSILEEAKTGKGFPCFAYAEVLRASLNAVGIPTRRLALKTKNVETDQYASGHVVNEAYLRDLKKWVFLDPQEDIMPFLHGKPLNAVELQQILTTHYDKVELRSLSAISKPAYVDFVYPYLYYFDAAFDQRYGEVQKISFGGMTSLMLVPEGSKNPVKAGFYNNQLINYCVYTNCLQDFYKVPSLR
jgi:hypothetical protein